MNNTDYQKYISFLIEKQNALNAHYKNTLICLASNNQETKVNNTNALKKLCSDLKSIVSAKNIPGWIQILINGANKFVDNPQVTSEWLMVLVVNYKLVTNYSWANDQSKIYSIDEIYEDIKSTYGVENLFDNLIMVLQKLVESGHVDSKKALLSLEELVKILNDNKDGSFTSIRTRLWFCDEFLQKDPWKLIEEINELKADVNKIKGTLDEIDSKEVNLKQKIRYQLTKKYNATFDGLSASENCQINFVEPTFELTANSEDQDEN